LWPAAAVRRGRLRAGRADGDASEEQVREHNGAAGAGAARQSAACALLVRPARFGYNSETAQSNHFQSPGHSLGDPSPQAQARLEFDGLVAALRAAGVRACVAEDTAEPVKPDAVFPNNWVSWHRDGTIVLYPLSAPNRRVERRMELLDVAAEQAGFQRRRLIDLSAHELEGRYLEGTGSLVLDHVYRVAYACRSARTDERLLRQWARLLDYEPVIFDAHDAAGRPLYHTNVMLAVGTHWIVVCAAAIAAADRAAVLARLRAGGRELIDITPDAMHAFAGNLLELTASGAGAATGPPGRERRVLAMSVRARAALGAHSPLWGRLHASVDEVIAVPVPTIEALGGGSVRCMLCEIPAVDA
jgi:hypothetical protein